MKDSICDILENHKQALKNKKIIVKTNKLTHVIVKIDSRRIEQVFNNILNNAIKFTPHDGTIEVSTHLENDVVKFSISDSGAGIPKEDIPLDKSIQYNMNGTDEEKGTGLGLVICQELLKLHGSELLINNATGKGCTFSFYLKTVSS